eukprot:352965-Chlamydomonas_euryale.AAC.35
MHSHAAACVDGTSHPGTDDPRTRHQCAGADCCAQPRRASHLGKTAHEAVARAQDRQLSGMAVLRGLS